MKKKDTRVSIKPKEPAPMTREELEDQMILKVYNKVNERIDNNEATAMEYVHFLKLGSSEAKLSRAREKMEMELTKAKTESMAREKNIEKLYSEAIKAYKKMEYNTDNDLEEDEDEP